MFDFRTNNFFNRVSSLFQTMHVLMTIEKSTGEEEIPWYAGSPATESICNYGCLCVQVTCKLTAATTLLPAVASRRGSLGGKERQTVDDKIRTYCIIYGQTFCRALGTARL